MRVLAYAYDLVCKLWKPFTDHDQHSAACRGGITRAGLLVAAATERRPCGPVQC
jgi:hypothetical protein